MTNARKIANMTFRFHADSRSSVEDVIHASTMGNVCGTKLVTSYKFVQMDTFYDFKSETRATWEGEMNSLARRCYFSPVPPSAHAVSMN